MKLAFPMSFIGNDNYNFSAYLHYAERVAPNADGGRIRMTQSLTPRLSTIREKTRPDLWRPPAADNSLDRAIEQLEQRVPVGSPAPAFALPDQTGAMVSSLIFWPRARSFWSLCGGSGAPTVQNRSKPWRRRMMILPRPGLVSRL